MPGVPEWLQSKTQTCINHWLHADKMEGMFYFHIAECQINADINTVIKDIADHLKDLQEDRAIQDPVHIVFWKNQITGNISNNICRFLNEGYIK